MSTDPTSSGPADPARRRVITGLAASAAGAAGLISRSGPARASSAALPNPADCGIDHIVVVMMENRSFDHMLGWLPGANGMQQGLTYLDSSGSPQSTFALAQNSAYGFQGCGHADPDHSYQAGHNDYDNGLMNGFLQPQPLGDLFPIGYYQRGDVQFYSACADNWTIGDSYHTGILSCTLPNRMYMHAGQTDRLSNTLTISTLPTIWDGLIANNISCKYYYSDTPVIALWGLKYILKEPITHPLKQFVADFAPGGTPPAVSYVDPYMGLFIGESLGTSWDDHAFADIRDGQCFLNYIYNIVRSSPAWDRTLLIVNYDEWGGFFDHVPPPTGPVSPAEAALGNDGRLGIRTPLVVIGPKAKRAHVENTQLDPNSILNFIGWRFGFTPPGVRATTSINLANILDFSSTDNSAPQFNVSYNGATGPFPLTAPFTPPQRGAAGTFGGACPIFNNDEQPEVNRRNQTHYIELQELQKMGQQYGLSYD
jgi:phospholipase C